MSKSIDVEAIKYLLDWSDYHGWWGVEEVEKYIRPPMMLGQYMVLRDASNMPICFATWAFPDYEHVVEYTDNLEFMPEGYDGGGTVPWIIDFIAIGGKRNIAIGFRNLKSMLSNMGYTNAYWLRTETQKLGFHDWS
jgi:hemolysin-activating ACP:hemolysin acyltransferase